ncbi:acyl-CoA dehydrogenase family protein [Streptomyces sp. DT171]|uniref:acyl-CoA dehydrogenase family protein n=1 Tax=Streptomyces sp. DT171 TaxID=3416524 RepID=UPI003CF6928D
MPDAPPRPGPGAAGMPRAHEAVTPDFATVVEQALHGVPSGADGTELWSALGRNGILRDLYGEAAQPTPDRMSTLLTSVDARADNGTTLRVLVQTASALPLLRSCPGPSCAAAYAQALNGDAQVALAATDSAAPGSDLTALGTEVDIDGGTLTLRGGKRWVTGLLSAQHVLVLARHRPGRHFTSFTWVRVPRDAPGVHREPAGNTLLNSADIGHLTLREVRLPRTHLVGRPGRALASFARHMATERLAGAQWATALARRTLTATHRHLLARESGGEPLWHNPAVRQTFASSLVDLAQLQALVQAQTPRIAQDRDLNAAVLLKAAVGMTLDSVLARCAQLQGADGMADGGAQHIRAETAVCSLVPHQATFALSTTARRRRSSA